MSNETPVPRELRDVLAVFTFFDKMVIVQENGQVNELPRNTVPAGQASAPLDVLMPELGTAIHQGEGAIRLFSPSGPDVILTTGVVRAILAELCDKNAGLVGEIYRSRTGLAPQ